MSTLRVNAIQNTSGVQQYLAKAWVNFDGTGSTGANQTIRASGNVSSVYKNGTGDYTVNFTSALADANYSIVGMGSNNLSSPSNIPYSVQMDYRQTASAARITTGNNTGNLDFPFVSVAIFR